MENDKISVGEYINDNSLLSIQYIPFDSKMRIVRHVISGVIDAVGGLNTSLLRRISTEVIIESITNIDMNKKDENDLSGFDQLCLNNCLEQLKTQIGSEYNEFEKILNETVSDYLRIETNPALTINKIYDQVKEAFNVTMEYLSEKIQTIDVEEISNNIARFISTHEGGGIE